MIEDSLKTNIEQIGMEFTHYKNGTKHKMQPIIEGWGLKVADLVDQLDDYWLFLSMIADKGVFNQLSKGSMHLVAKSMTDISGISACLKHGLPVQAFTLLRSLWETTVTTKYIYQDFDTRMDDFIRYADIVRYKKFKKHPELIPDDQIEKTKQAFQEVKHRFKWRDDWYYPSMRMEIKIRKLDPQKVTPNMHTMAKLVGLGEEYDTMYNTLSKPVHGASVIDHLFRENGRFQGGLKFDRGHSTNIVGLAIHCGDILLK